MIGRPERFGVYDAERASAVEHAGGLALQVGADRVAARSLTSKPASTVASEATGDGPEYRYGGAATLSRFLSSVGQAMNASSDE